MNASIIIATYNRAAYLSRCLEALAALETDPTMFEIIIVDNNSSDNTREVVQGFVQEHPTLSIHYLFEKEQGAALARNSAIAEASGEILCFLDDDTVPTSGWLSAIAAGFADPGVGCVGGPAILDFQGRERPPWLLGDLQGLLSGYGLLYTEPTAISKIAEYPFLCNMAVRRSVLAEVGSFRPDLGRSGGSLLAGEETELVDRMYKAGWRVMYLPDAKVWHLVAPERLDKQYIYRVGMGLAATHVYLTSRRQVYYIIRWFASDAWYATRMLFKLLVAIVQRRALWFDDYMRFWMVAQRIPVRFRALLNGYTASYFHSMKW
jgi:GT2 family glycosyltransferase